MGRLAVGEISPMALVAARWFGVVVLSAIFLRKSLIRDWPILKQHWRFVLFMGSVGFTIFNVLFYVAAHHTLAINIGIVQGAIPIFVMLGSMLVYRIKIGFLQATGVFVTLIGVLVIVTAGEFERLIELSVNYGDFLMLIACVFYSIYAIGLRKRPNVSPLSLFAAMACVAFLIAIPFASFEAMTGGYIAPTTTGLVIVGLVVIFPSFVSQLSFILGVDKIGPARAGIFVNLVPIFAAGMAVVFVDEEFQFFHGAALALVLFGIFLSERFKRVN